MIQIGCQRYEDSLFYFEKIISSTKAYSVPVKVQIQAYHALAFAHNMLNQPEKALSYIEEGLCLNRTYVDLIKLKESIQYAHPWTIKKESEEQLDCITATQKIYREVYPEKQIIPSNFWQLMRSGFMSGHGVIFLDKLKESGIYQHVFTSDANANTTELNEAWFKERVKLLDEKNGSPIKTLSIYALDVLLVAKELTTFSKEEIQKIHKQFNLSIPCNDKFCTEVQLKFAQKQQFKPTKDNDEILQQKTLPPSSRACF